MVDLSALTSQDAADENARLAANSPIPTATPPSFGEAFSAAWDETKYYGSLGARYNSQADFLQSSLDQFKQKTGEDIPNPMKIDGGLPTAERMIGAFDYARSRYAAAATPGTDSRVPDKDALQFPTDQEIADGGAALSRKSLLTAADVNDRSAGPVALAGHISGGFLAGATDPLNAIAMAAIPEGGIALKMLAAAGAFAAQTGVEDAVTANYKNAVNPNGFDAGDVRDDMLSAAAGGAVMELGGHLIGKLIGLGWRRLLNRDPAAAAALPLEIRDAGTVAERSADLDAQQPFATGSSGDAAHNDAVMTIERQILDGKPSVLPDSAVAEGQKRTGQVFTAVPRSAATELEDTAPRSRELEDTAPRSRELEDVGQRSNATLSTRSPIAPGPDAPGPIAPVDHPDLDQAIEGFQGSPHGFLAMNADKIGSGEGTQAFGQGLYMAARRRVAEWYRNTYTPAGQPGHLYQIKFLARHDQLIDWDKPLSGQSLPVRSVLEHAGYRDENMDRFRSDLRQAGSGRALAAGLHEQGVKGVRYFDARSRSAQRGTRNFVAFSDKDMIITHRDDIPILDHALKEAGIDPATVSGAVRDKTLDIMVRDRVTHPLDAYQLAVKSLTDDAEASAGRGEPEPQPEAGEADDTQPKAGTQQDGEAGPNDSGAAPAESSPVGPVSPVGFEGPVGAPPGTFDDFRGQGSVAQSVDRRAFYGQNKAVKVKYELAEAADLITSHDDGFHENPAYPQSWQPRNRGGKPAMAQVAGLVNNLQPERLGPNVEANSGAPIVGPDNIVESGNGRAMAVRMAYEKGEDGGYRAFLEREGFDTSGYKSPVLVGRRVTPMTDAEREAFAHAANGSASLRLGTTEQALADARHLTSDTASLARPGALTNVANRDFVRSFVGKLPPGEHGEMLNAKDGSLSSDGEARLRQAIFARAYNDPTVIARLYEDTDVNIKVIGHALETASADWMRMRDAVTEGKLPPGQDVTENVMEAVRSVMKARDTGRPVSEVLAQGNMFASDVTSLVTRLFMKAEDTTKFRAKDDMARNVTDFAHNLRAGIEQGTNLMGEAPRTAEQVLKDTADAADRRLATLVNAAKSSKAIEAALSDPKMDDNMFAGLTRDIEQGNNKFVTEDGKAGVADVALAKIESDEALANEINACSLPPAAEAAE